MQSSSSVSKTPDNSYRSPQLPGHLYNRGGIFYFRLVLTEKLRLRFGRVEIRLSLRTAYRRRALELSRRLYAHFYETVENEPMISYKELRRRLNIYLQMQLEDDHNNILARPVIKDAPVMPGDLADYCEADIYRHRAEWFQKMTNDPNDLNDYFQFIKQELTRCGMLLPGESNKNNRLQIVKAYFESQVTLFRLLEKRCHGDYLTEESIVSADFGKLPKTANY